MLGRLCLIALPLLGMAGGLFGLIRLGAAAQQQLTGRSRYRVAFADIDCEPPPGLRRDEFLSEVQYLARWPDDFGRLDDHLSSRLSGAFLRHPWVEAVERIEIGGKVVVRLRYRTPVLAVPYRGLLRAVDGQGVLLPAAADTTGLPRYRGTVDPPRGPAGTVWGDPGLVAAARTLAYLREREHGPAWTDVESSVGGRVTLTGPGGVRVVWGHAPGEESDGEDSAERKRERLFAAGALDGGRELDLARPE
jgi:hypothetical protein